MLELVSNIYEVRSIAFGDSTFYKEGVLSINRAEVEALIREDENVGEITLSLTKPGDSARIVHVWDVIEPRTKVDGPGAIFPGWLDAPISYAEGTMNRMPGAAVVTCTEYSPDSDAYTVQCESIIDMSGPAAEICPYSQTNNLVMEILPRDKMSIPEHNKMVTKAGLKIAKYLADVTIGQVPSKTETYALGKKNPNLPNVALLLVVSGSTAALDTYINGFSCVGIMPTLIHPNEILQGSLVASTALVASIKNFTYDYQNNALINELFKDNGVKHNFVGVVVERGYAYEYDDKVRLSSHAANLIRHLEADGVIITREGGGNILLETMLACRECEERGIKTAIVMSEFCGHQGTGSPFVDSVPEADLIVSTGNTEELMEFPEMEVAYGGKTWIATDVPSNKAIKRSIYDTVASANSMLGHAKLKAYDY